MDSNDKRDYRPTDSRLPRDKSKLDNRVNGSDQNENQWVSDANTSPQDWPSSNAESTNFNAINKNNIENDYNGNDNLITNQEDFEGTDYNDTDQRREMRTPGL